jgi:calcineurin-like phosphoesterase
MTGPHDSIIGVEVEPALNRFLTSLPQKFDTATANPRLNAVVIEADENSGMATDIERVSLSAAELQELASIADGRPVRSPV